MAFVLSFLTSCATLTPGVILPADLGGHWTYVGGEPTDDALLNWAQWPDVGLDIDAAQGHWRVWARQGAHTVLPAEARVTRIDGTVLTLVPTRSKGRPFQVYYRLVDGRLEFWWGDHPDWLKPHVTYRHP